MVQMGQGISHKYEVIPNIKGTILAVSPIDGHFRIVIPKSVREALGIGKKDRIYWVESEDKLYHIVKAHKLH